jgi:hypothetical protein
MTALTALLAFIQTTTRSWATTTRTIALIAGTAWLPIIAITLVLAHTHAAWLTTALTATGITATHRIRRRTRKRPSAPPNSTPA